MPKTISEETKFKHLELIHRNISRMSNCSFTYKGWTVAIVAGMLALLVKHNHAIIMIFALLPAVCFSLMDTYYLRQERLFRELYKEANLNNVESYSMDTTKYEDKVDNYRKTACSFSIAGFYGIIIMCVLGFSWIVHGLQNYQDNANQTQQVKEK